MLACTPRRTARTFVRLQIMQASAKMPRDYADRVKIETFRVMCQKWPVIAFAAVKAQEAIWRVVMGEAFWKDKQVKFQKARDSARDARAVAIATGGRVKDIATVNLILVEEAVKKSDFIAQVRREAVGGDGYHKLIMQAFVEEHAIVGMIAIVVVNVERCQLWQKSLGRPVRAATARPSPASHTSRDICEQVTEAAALPAARDLITQVMISARKCMNDNSVRARVPIRTVALPRDYRKCIR